MKINQTYCLWAAVTSLSLLLGGCARNISPHVYSEKSVDEAADTYEGVVLTARRVTVKGSESLKDNTIGGAAGGVTGAVLGSMIGGGRGSALAAVGGGLLGAVGGAYAQDALSTQEGMQYVVRLTNGQLKTIVQGTDVNIPVGSRVLVMISHHKGRSRIVPI
jgi:outer membrane lipoprotein SlyB